VVEEPAPVVPEFSGKMKKKARSQVKVTPWKRFEYQSREGPGAVTLSHVRPLDDPLKNQNGFLKVNKPMDLRRYDDASYAAKLQSAAWTRAETDELMRLAEQFGGRLVVVHDRWPVPRFAPRSLEQIKERYYEVQRLLARDPAGEFVFDLAGAVARKRHMELLYNRNGNEVWEEFEAKNEFERVAAELAKAHAAPARARALMTALERGVRDYAAAAAASAVKSESRKSDAWSPSDARGKPKKRPKLKNSQTGGGETAADGVGAAQLPAAVDGYLRNVLSVPIRPSGSAESAAAHAELRGCVMVLLDMQVLLSQKLYQVELLKEQIAGLEQDKPGV
jgi:hypothetical protein